MYVYNTSNAGVPVFLKFNTYPEMGPAITGSASLYSPAPCSVTAVWNASGWVNNVKPDINKKAIINADYIIIGPGDLYTSIVPNLLCK